MKLTPSLKDYIITNFEKYAAQMGIPEHELPSLVFTSKDWASLPKVSNVKNISRKSARVYGAYCRNINTIFLNVRKSPSRVRLRETIVHELLHVRFPYLRHGRYFDDGIDKVIKKKKSFPPYKPKTVRE